MNLNVNTTLTTLRTGIWFSSRFKEQLKVQPPILLENVIHHALAYYLLEDKTTIFSAKHSRDPSPLPLANKIPNQMARCPASITMQSTGPPTQRM